MIQILSLLQLFVFADAKPELQLQTPKIEITIGSSFTLINDTKEKVWIYTGSGFVSLNKGSKTSIGCSIGKEVRFAESGKKGVVIFKITSSHCGKTIKLSEYTK